MREPSPAAEFLLCRKCNYDLRGVGINPHCPECGTLNLFTEPFEGLEQFEYCAKAHNNSTFICLVGVALGLPVLLAIYRSKGQAVLITFGIVMSIAIVSMHFLNKLVSSRKSVALDWDSKTVVIKHAIFWGLPLPRYRRVSTTRFSDLISHGFIHSRHHRWLKVTTADGTALIPDYLGSVDLLAQRLQLIRPQPEVSTKISIIRVTVATVIAISVIGAAVWLAIEAGWI